MSVAVIGAGNWGKNLVANFQQLGALSAVAEASPALREGLAGKYPELPLYDDYQAVLVLPEVQAVAIATPVPTHFAIAKEALLAGKDAFVEKPLTLSLAEAEELAAIAEREGRVLMVGHLLLYQPAIQWIKAYLAEGKLGQLHSLHQERLNLGRARAVENVLWSFGVHDVAVLLHLVGSAPTDIAVTGQRILQPAVEDDVYLHLGFAGGVRAHLHTSWLWPELRRGLTVVGSEGMLVYDEVAQTVTLHRKGITPDLANRNEGSEVVFSGSGEPLKLELEHFLARVADRARPLSDAASGVEVVRVLDVASRQLEAK